MLKKLKRIFSWGALQTANNEMQKQNDTEAEAIVLGIYKTGHYIDDQPQMKLQIQVLPDKGRNFIAEAFLLVGNKKIDAGLKIKVRYNATNNKVLGLIL